MTIQELGSLGELVGALLLFVSLVYVGLQIRQNTKSQQAQIRQSFSDLVISWSRYLLDHPELIELIRRGEHDGFESMDDLESQKLGMHFQAAMWGFSALHRHYRDGMVDDETWSEVDDLVAHYARSKAVQEYWNQSNARFGKSYRAYFDAKLEVGA